MKEYITGLKHCTQCNEYKPLASYGKNKSLRDGLLVGVLVVLKNVGMKNEQKAVLDL